MNFNANVYDITVSNVENINAGANFDRITIGNTSGNTTITAGAGADEIFAGAGHDNFRFASIADSATGAADTIHNFDADNDSFSFSGASIAGGHIEYVDSAALLGANQASAICSVLGLATTTSRSISTATEPVIWTLACKTPLARYTMATSSSPRLWRRRQLRGQMAPGRMRRASKQRPPPSGYPVWRQSLVQPGSASAKRSRIYRTYQYPHQRWDTGRACAFMAATSSIGRSWGP
ncbi:M10 family metallopeptidase C-terminal domain-containing protein [Bradyrhizobium sp. LMG 9283]|uniref:M10 family metallopeptidase C-terminal domain-containing protein n=1 Tax=Bradyrhizobium sp. LMG 9283 TaxID=592064 RepID=UPI003890125A